MNNNWIQLAFDDDKYQVVPMFGNGDCFFEAVITALKSNKKYKDNPKLTVQNIRKTIANLLTEEIFQTYVDIWADSIKEKNGESLFHYHFMQNCKSLEDLKQMVSTNVVFANDTIIALFEKTFKIKIILFSKVRFIRRTPPFIETAEVIDESIDPQYYILLDYNGGHFDLCSWNREVLFTLETLPVFLKAELWRNVPLFQKKVLGWQQSLNLLN